MPPRAKRMLFRIFRVILVAYLGLLIVLYFLQSWFIYPGHSTQQAADAKILRTPPHVELLWLHASGDQKIAALFGPAFDKFGVVLSDHSHVPTVIFFYGNAMCLNYSWEQLRFFRQLGCNVLIPDFIGYGMSTGTPSEANCYHTAGAAWDYLQTRPDVDKSRIIAAGWSLGAASAIELAARKSTYALITFSAFTSTRAMARKILPWFPIGPLLRDKFDNLAKIPLIHCPTLIVQGQEDKLVSPTMATQLAQASPNAELLHLPDADHNTVFDADPELLEKSVAAFLASLPNHRTDFAETNSPASRPDVTDK